MRIVKQDAYWDDCSCGDPAVHKADTIEIKLDDFREWYYQIWFRKEGGLIHYDSVPALIQEWLATLAGEGNDTEAH